MQTKQSHDDVVKFLALTEELEIALALVRRGFRALQEIDFGNDFYHLPHQLIASGLERFMKCYLCLVHRGQHGEYPIGVKDFGHDLEKLLDRILRHHFGTARPILREDHDFLLRDIVLRRVLAILSHFGKIGRYYNLDVVSGKERGRLNPKEEWDTLESSIVSPVEYANDLERLRDEYYPRVNASIIERLERMLRALCLQFTLGGHKDPEGNMRRLWSVVSEFGALREFGTNDYRRTTVTHDEGDDVWAKVSDDELGRANFPTRVVRRGDLPEEWPFNADQVVVACQDRVFAIAYIGGYAFALNGAARSRFKYPDPHAAGLARFGKSVGPFTKIALSL